MTQHPVTPQEAREALAAIAMRAELPGQFGKPSPASLKTLGAFIAQQSPAAQGGAQQSEGDAVERAAKDSIAALLAAVDTALGVEHFTPGSLPVQVKNELLQARKLFLGKFYGNERIAS